MLISIDSNASRTVLYSLSSMVYPSIVYPTVFSPPHEFPPMVISIYTYLHIMATMRSNNPIASTKAKPRIA